VQKLQKRKKCELEPTHVKNVSFIVVTVTVKSEDRAKLFDILLRLKAGGIPSLRILRFTVCHLFLRLESVGEVVKVD